MSYDDEENGKAWRGWEELVAILDRFSRPEELTVTQLIQLVRALHRGAQGRAIGELPLTEVLRSLRAHDLGTLPLQTVANAIELVSEAPTSGGVLEHITLAQVEELVLPQPGEAVDEEREEL